MEIQTRKLKHLEACLRKDAQYQTLNSGFEKILLRYCALPEISLGQIDLSSSFLGKKLSAPFLIGAMTGGEQHGATINRNLAIAAQRLGVGMMLGSQRIMLERPETQSTFAVREFAEDILLIGNLGLAQLGKGYTFSEVDKIASLVAADAVALHTNPLQEAVQGGDTDFSGLISRLEHVAKNASVPILLKEVGHGFSAAVAKRLLEIPLAAIDIAGAGGTSWARVEEIVRYGRVSSPELCEIGIPTAQSLREVRHVLPSLPVIASGGIRSGTTAVKALAMGADLVAVAQPLLKAAMDSAEAVEDFISRFLEEIRMAMFAVGARSIADLSPNNLLNYE